jgi:hypothetical protein
MASGSRFAQGHRDKVGLEIVGAVVLAVDGPAVRPTAARWPRL